MKKHTYNKEKYDFASLVKAAYEEIPEILPIKYIKKYFDLSYNMKALWGGTSDEIVHIKAGTLANAPPQLYILLSCNKRKET